MGKECQICQDFRTRLKPLASAVEEYEQASRQGDQAPASEWEQARTERAYHQLRNEWLAHEQATHPRRQKKAQLAPGIYTSKRLERHWLVVDARRRHYLVPFPDPKDVLSGLTPWERRWCWTRIPDELEPAPLDHWSEMAASFCRIPADLFQEA